MGYLHVRVDSQTPEFISRLTCHHPSAPMKVQEKNLDTDLNKPTVKEIYESTGDIWMLPRCWMTLRKGC